jgi:carboxyl-terminal processing protease
VVLIDGRTRSAKEVLAYYFKRYRIADLVGERTEGAVLGAAFSRLGDNSVLMYPVKEVSVLGHVNLEGIGVEPHYEVNQPFEYARGIDYITAKGVEVLVSRIERGEGKRLVARASSSGAVQAH